MHIFRLWQKHVQRFKKNCLKLYEELHTQGPYNIWAKKMSCVQNAEKKDKNISGIYQKHMHIFRPWQKHLQSFEKSRPQL